VCFLIQELSEEKPEGGKLRPNIPAIATVPTKVRTDDIKLYCSIRKRNHRAQECMGGQYESKLV
jgi:hypothetical protein